MFKHLKHNCFSVISSGEDSSSGTSYSFRIRDVYYKPGKSVNRDSCITLSQNFHGFDLRPSDDSVQALVIFFLKVSSIGTHLPSSVDLVAFPRMFHIL